MANEFKVKKGLIVTGSGSTIFDVQGSQGQLFSVTDSLIGELFSVNDISGIPILTVSSDDTVNIGTYGAEAIKVNGSNTTLGGTFQNSSIWINNGVNNNGYNENIRLFNAPNGVSVIAFGATGVSGPPQSSILGYSDRLEFRIGTSGNPSQKMFDTNVEAMGSYRAPIFYDSNNTGYYLDPASTSNINAVNIAGSTNIFGGYGPGSGPGLAFENQSSFIRLAFWDMDFYDWNTGSVLRLNSFAESSTSFRAPIFYDKDNTGYYLDPASTSNLYNLTVNQTIVGSINGNAATATNATYANSSGTAGAANYLSILGGSGGNLNTMGYGRYYNYGSGSYWTNGPSSMSYGSVYNLGGTSESSLSLQLAADINHNSTSSTNKFWFRTGNNLGFQNDWKEILHSGNYPSFSNFGTNAVYGGIYYDGNNTGYYCDPADTSRMVTNNVDTYKSLNGLFNTQDVSVNSTYGVYWQPTQSNDYGIYKAAGAWTQPLHINFYTGLRLRSHQSYGGTQFFNLNTSNTVMGVNNGDNNVHVYTALYSPIMYDENNTGYYIDPASTSNLNACTFAGTIAVGGTVTIAGTSSNIIMGDSDEGNRTIHCNSNRVGFLNQSGSWGSWCEDGGDWNTDFISYAGASHRAPIFYDTNNTGYYLDPASTSNLNGVSGAYIGVSNTNSTTGYGLSLYGGASAGQPTYGIMFAGTSTFGTFGGVTADWATYFTMDSTANRGWIFRDTTNGNKASISNTGVATFAGDVVAYGSSDRELKDNIKPIENSLEKLKQIGGYTFDWNDKQTTYEGHDVGVIAQEIELVLPEVVTTRDNGYKAVKYEKITPLLIEAIKEQQKQIDELNALVNQLIQNNK